MLGGLHPHTSLPAIGLIALAGILASFRKLSSQGQKFSQACLAAGGIFIGYVLVRGFLSEDAYIARADLYLAVAAFTTYLIFSFRIVSTRLRVRFAYFLLLIAAANFVVGGIQFFKGGNFMPFPFLPRENYGARASGFYGCPNHLAGFLEIAMLFGISIACWSRAGLLARITAGYGALMCAAGILLSGSRGGYASSMAGLVAFGFVSLLLAGKWLRREFWYATIAAVITAGAAGGYVVKSMIGESQVLTQRVEVMNSDVKVRTSLAASALEQFKISPVFGTGSATYRYYGREFRNSFVIADPIYAHNDYLQLLAEYGVVGFAGLIVFVGLHLRSGWNAIRVAASDQKSAGHDRATLKRSAKGSRSRSAWRAVGDEESKRAEQMRPAFKGSHSLALTVGAFCSVVAYVVHSIVDFNLHIPANACVMAFVVAILANPGITASAAERTPQSLDLGKSWSPVRFLPAALGIWFLVVALPKWPGELYCEKARVALSDWRTLDSSEPATRAEAFCQKGLSYDRKNARLFAYLGDAQFQLAEFATDPATRTQHLEDSVASFKSALAISSRDTIYLMGLGASLDGLKRFDEAEAQYLLAIKLDPNAGQTHTAYAMHLQARGKLEQAETEFAIALKLRNTHAEYVRLESLRKELAEKKAGENRPPSAPN